MPAPEAPLVKEVSMFKGFRDFIVRGNVIELAIAVVIGTAFTALVGAFAKFIINPIIAAFGGQSVDGLAFYLVRTNKATLVDIGSLITALLTFFITAAVVYFVFVLPMNKLSERRKADQVPGVATPTELSLLIEIRDLLAERKTAEEAG
jgi:large conductance mechanosensitive channel